MISIQWRGEEDLYRSLVRIESIVEKGSDDLVREAAEMLVRDIRSSWSGTRQTIGSGNPPATKGGHPDNTGNLDSSVIVETSGRDVLGRFSNADNTRVRFVRINTAEGDDPQGRGNYAQILENNYNLPFIQPAVDRLAGVYDDMAKRYMRL